MATSKIDSKGRVLIPKQARDELGLQPGDTVFFNWTDNQLHVARAANPFEVLAADAIRDHDAGDTKSIEDFADELGIELGTDE